MSGGLKRSLGTRELIFLIIGSVIGSGIFLVPGEVFRAVAQSWGASVSLWIAGGFLSLLGALSYAELGARNPAAGGIYVFLRDAFGDRVAFLFGFAQFVIIGTGNIATLTVALVLVATNLFPLTFVQSKVLALLVILGLTLVNLRDTATAAGTQNVMTATKLAALVVLGCGFLLFGHFHPPQTQATPSGQGHLAGYTAGLLAVLWAFEGWQYVTYVAGEAVAPQRTLPRALFLAVMALTVVYLLMNAGYYAVLGSAGLSAPGNSAVAALSVLVGNSGARLIAVLIMLSILSAAHGTLFTTSRIFFAMANDGLFPKGLGRLDPVRRVPSAAVIATASWAAVLAMTGTFDQLLSYVICVGWGFYGLTGLAVIILRRRASSPGSYRVPRGYRVPMFPWTPIVFVVSSLVIVMASVVSQPVRAVFGGGLLIVALVTYQVWYRHARTSNKAVRTASGC